MWLIDRLIPHTALLATPSDAGPIAQGPDAPPEAGARRLTLKRPVRAGRLAISPWQKVAAPSRRSRH